VYFLNDDNLHTILLIIYVIDHSNIVLTYYLQKLCLFVLEAGLSLLRPEVLEAFLLADLSPFSPRSILTGKSADLFCLSPFSPQSILTGKSAELAHFRSKLLVDFHHVQHVDFTGATVKHVRQKEYIQTAPLHGPSKLTSVSQ
jgi:hypothetical protein